jgi:hydroxymethylglutaryl-CoA reductase
MTTSRLPGFADRSMTDRLDTLAEGGVLDAPGRAALESGGLTADLADRMVENAVGAIAIPVGVATNLVVDGREVLVPMATEESSVVAAVCNAARRCRATGGFQTDYDGGLTIAQVQLLDVPDPLAARVTLLARRAEIAARCDAVDPMLARLGGGLRDVEVRIVPAPEGAMTVVHLIVDTRDAMGANAVNAMAEALAPDLAAWTGGRALLRILSNLADRRLARARAVWPLDEIGGPAVRDAMLAAARFAECDPYRAATHNKGVMNGVSAVTLATGNDTRAVEAGAHAFAARDGRYRPLTAWAADGQGRLSGAIELPTPLGVVGGATRVHPVAQAALRMMGVADAATLARIVAAVGLAQNFAALRALATEGINRGHMRLHARNVAIAAGAQGDEIEAVAQAIHEAGAVRPDAAEEALAALRGGRA